MRIVVLGTGPFAVPSLRALHASQHEMLCAVSRPPRGRRAKPAPVFVAAEELGLETWLPETVNCDEACEKLATYEADLLVVCDYGEILKPKALASTRLGGINLHGSLLPKYRGAAPVQWAVYNGDVENGQHGHTDDAGARRRAGARRAAHRNRPRRNIGRVGIAHGRLGCRLGAENCRAACERYHESCHARQKPSDQSTSADQRDGANRLVAIGKRNQKPGAGTTTLAAGVYGLGSVWRARHCG